MSSFNMMSQQGFHFNGPNLQNSFNMAFSQMVLQISHICQHLHAHKGHSHFQMSSLTRWVNKDFKLIKQTCRIPVTWNHLGEYHIWTILANIFMLIKDIISPRWACYHVNSIGISFWLTKFQDSCSMALSGMVLHFGHIGHDFLLLVKV